MRNKRYTLSLEELRTIHAVFESLENAFTTRELNTFIGDLTIERMQALNAKIGNKLKQARDEYEQIAIEWED